MMNLFRLQDNHTTVKRELLAGITTFFTMAYIIIIAPMMLEQAGMSHGAAFVATCVIAAFASVLSGLISNLPFAMAPGLGLLAYFSYVVVHQPGLDWHSGLAAVCLSGMIFFLITVTRIRELILAAIPPSLGCSIAAGIGFFIGFIALKNIGLVVGNHETLVALGQLRAPSIALFFLGFFIISILDYRQTPGAILIGMAITTLLGMAFGITHFQGLMSLPPSMAENVWQMHFSPLAHWQAFPVIFTFLIVALFDSTGAMIGLSHQMGAGNSRQQFKRINRALFSESIATTAASIIGSTTVSPFIENAAGVKAGGRTGLTAIIVAGLFLLALFFAPLANSIPNFATSAALFYVSCMMIKPFAKVDWHESSEFIPAIITLLMIPLTFSIADGVGLGVICYVMLNLALKRWRKIHPFLAVLAIVFLVYFLMPRG